MGPAAAEFYPLSLHDALPIWRHGSAARNVWKAGPAGCAPVPAATAGCPRDRKSTRLNSSHVEISYAVFCLKKKTHVSRVGDLKRPIRRVRAVGRSCAVVCLTQ